MHFFYMKKNLKIGWEKYRTVLKCTQMRARVEKVDVLGWNKSNCTWFGITLHAFFTEVNTICIWTYIQWQRVTQVRLWVLRKIWQVVSSKSEVLNFFIIVSIIIYRHLKHDLMLHSHDRYVSALRWTRA